MSFVNFIESLNLLIDNRHLNQTKKLDNTCNNILNLLNPLGEFNLKTIFKCKLEIEHSRSRAWH